MPFTTRRFSGGLLALAVLLAARPGTADSCLCGTAADELVAARAGLDREWIVQAPFDSAGWRLEHVVIGNGLVIAQSGDGTATAIVSESAPGSPRPGTVAWSRQIGRGPAPVQRAGIGDSAVAVARGKTVTLLDARSGAVLWERPLRTMASAAALPSAGWVYAPLDAGGILRLPLNPAAVPVPEDGQAAADDQAKAAEPATGPRPGERLDPVEISSEGEVDFQPLPFDGGILWCTANGRIGAITRSTKLSKRLAFDLGTAASGPPVIRDGDLFVATSAGDVARLAQSPLGLTANTGVMKNDDDQDVAFSGWHQIVEARPEGSPLVGTDVVVLSLGPAGLAGFAAATGDVLWQVPAAARPLAIVGDRVWCLEETGFLVARDLATGERRGRLCLGCFTIPVVNTATERLVLASPGGLVVSLAPRRTEPAGPPVPQPPAADPDQEPAAAPAEAAP